MRAIVFGMAFIGMLSLAAQEFAVDLIPEELKKNANAVIRKDNDLFKILSIDKAESSTDYAVTVLNEKGKAVGNFVAYYDKLSSISDIEINVYDKYGERTRKIKSSEILDASAVSGGSLFDDSRVKWFEIDEASYPYTVEYKYTKKYKFLYFIPNKYFYSGQHIGVESSSQVLEYPVSVGARYKEQLFTGEKNETELDGIKQITWRMAKMPAFEMEPYGPAFSDVVPLIKLSPAKFSYEGYEGDMSTWDGLAKWQKSLNEGRDVLSEETTSRIVDLTKDLSDIEKIKAVYQYVQSNTRYVNVNEGVGGLQPFPASVVDEVGYGDCKALSNYTKSLLKVAGIPAFYTKVKAGDNPGKIERDFPSQFSNHVILCVPNKQDTVWLECTSQTNPFGFQGNFTGNREVLVINEEGGKIVKTNYYRPEINVKSTNLLINVEKTGNAILRRNTSYTGLTADFFHDLVTRGSEKQKEWIQKNMQLSTFEVNDFSLSRGENEAINFSTTLSVNKLLSASGTRMFLQPNVMNKNTFVPQKLKERKFDVIIETGFIEYDTIKFNFPPAFRVEAIFEPIEIKSEFGEYRAEVQSDENGLRYVRYFRQNDGRFKSDTYQAYLEFNKAIVNADKRKIALISGT